MSLLMHVGIVVAVGYYSVYLTTAPLLLASSVVFLAKSYVDKEFRTWRLGPKLTHCLISSIFPVTTPRHESKKENTKEDSGSLITANVKMAGNELFFVYLLHFSILVLGMIAFTLLSADPEYAERIKKLENVSTISMTAMVYIVCPLALLLSTLSQLVYHQYFHPWWQIKSRIEPGSGFCRDFKPKPKSKVVHQQVPLNSSTDQQPQQDIELH